MIEATLKLAQIQIRTDDPAAAIVELEQLRKQQPRLLEGQLLLAEAYHMQDREGDSLAVYQGLETMYPTNAQVVLLHGMALLRSGDRTAARKAFEHVLEISPDNLLAVEELVDMDIKEKRFDAATQLVNRVIQDLPKQALPKILAGEILHAEGKNDQAEAILNQALTMGGDNVRAYLSLAQLYSDTGQTDKALDKVKAAMAKDPQNIGALWLNGQLCDAKKDYKSAAEAYEKLLKIDPKHSRAMNNLAYDYAEYLNNLDRAYELAQRAHKLLPYDPETTDTLGWVLFRKGSYSTALNFLQQSASKLSDPEVQYHFGMAAYMTADEATARTALQRAWQSGANFHGRDDCGNCITILDVNPATADQAALAMLEKRVAAKPDDPVALVRLARIYQRDGNTDKAIASYEAILQANPQNLDAMVNLTGLYAPKDQKKAYEMAKAASKLAPYDPDVSHTLGRMAFLSGDYQLAASALQQAVRNKPNDASLLFDYAQAAYSVGQVPDAQSAFQSALRLNLPAPQSDKTRSILYLIALAGSPAQASASSAHIVEALKSDPADVPALMAQAAASQFNSDTATATRDCEKALERYPDFAPAQLQLARLYVTQPGKLDRAYALASKAHEALPDDPDAAKILGIIYTQRGDYSDAVSLLHQTAMKMNSDPEVFYYLGVAQFHLKDRTGSKANLQQALALNLSGQPAQSAKQMLSELK